MGLRRVPATGVRRWRAANRPGRRPAGAAPRRGARRHRPPRDGAPSRRRRGPGTWMTTLVVPGRSRITARNASMAPTIRSDGTLPANRTCRVVPGPASMGSSAVASATIRARASSGTDGSSSVSGALSRRRPLTWTPVRLGRWPAGLSGPAPPRLPRRAAARRTGRALPSRPRRRPIPSRRPVRPAPARPGPAAGHRSPPRGARSHARCRCLGRGPEPRRPPRSPAATCRAKASSPAAAAASQSTARSASRETSSLLWSTRPATSRISPSRQVVPSARRAAGRRRPRSSPAGPRGSRWPWSPWPW